MAPGRTLASRNRHQRPRLYTWHKKTDQPHNLLFHVRPTSHRPPPGRRSCVPKGASPQKAHFATRHPFRLGFKWGLLMSLPPPPRPYPAASCGGGHTPRCFRVLWGACKYVPLVGCGLRLRPGWSGQAQALLAVLARVSGAHHVRQLSSPLPVVPVALWNVFTYLADPAPAWACSSHSASRRHKRTWSKQGSSSVVLHGGAGRGETAGSRANAAVQAKSRRKRGKETST